MTTNKLAIIGGSGLYDIEEFKDRKLIDLNTPWGKPSDQVLKTNYNNKEFFFYQDMEEAILFRLQILISEQILMHSNNWV